MKISSHTPSSGEIVLSDSPETDFSSERQVKVYFEADFWKLDFPLAVALRDLDVRTWLSWEPERREKNTQPPNRVREILSLLVLDHAQTNARSTGRNGLTPDELVNTLPLVAPEVVQTLGFQPRHFVLELGRLNGGSIGIVGGSVFLSDLGRERRRVLTESFEPRSRRARRSLGQLSAGQDR